MLYLLRAFLGLLAVFWMTPLRAAISTVEFLGDGLAYLREEKVLSIEEVSALPKEAFVETRNFQPNLGFVFKTLWFKTELSNIAKYDTTAILEIAYARMEIIEIFVLNNSNAIVFHALDGTEIPKKLRTMSHLNVAFPIPFHAEERLRVFIRTSSDSPLRFPVKIWEPEAFRSYQQSHQLQQGIYYGGIIIMVIYNMFVFIATRNRAYLYYCMFVLSTGSYLASDGGMLLQYVFTDNSYWNNKISLYSIFSANIFGIYFAGYFMNLKGNDPKVNRAVRWVLAPLLAMAILVPFVPYYIGGIALTVLSIFTSVLLIALTVRGLVRRQREAYFYAAAWTCLLLGTFAYGLLAMGFIESNFFTERGLQIGSFFEMTILSFALADRLNQLRLGLKDANDRLAYQVAHVEEQVSIKTRDIRSIMEHIPIGVFFIGKIFEIQKDYSRSMESLFQLKDLSGRDAVDVLFRNGQIMIDRKAQLQTALDSALGEAEIAFEINRHCFIDRMDQANAGGRRIYDLLWNPVYNEQGLIEKILVTVHDSTRLIALEQESAMQRHEMELVQRIIEVPVQGLHSFLRVSEQLLRECQVIASRAEEVLHDRHVFLMNIHTLKGTSRALYFTDISDSCHQMENKASQLPLARLEAEIKDLEALVSEYRKTAIEKLGRKLDHSQVVELRTELLQQVVQDLVQYSVKPFDREILSRIGQLEVSLYQSLPVVLAECLKSSGRLAEDLGKVNPKLVIEATGIGVTQDAYDILQGSLTHLLRNSLDHGLETAEQRQRNGKSPQGTISVKASTNEDCLKISFYDDGRGLAIQDLKQVGLKRGMILADASDLDIAEIIFAPEFSTNEAVSITSGRGMGLSAVRDSLRKQGGDVRLELLSALPALDGGRAFQLQLLLPSKLWTIMHGQNLPLSA